MEEFGIKIVLSISGVLIYSVWQVKDKIKEFDVTKFINDNKGYWIWTFILQFLAAVVLLVSPESATALLNIFGIDFTEPAAFFTSGIILSGIANEITSDKIGVKPMNGGELPKTKPPVRP